MSIEPLVHRLKMVTVQTKDPQKKISAYILNISIRIIIKI